MVRVKGRGSTVRVKGRGSTMRVKGRGSMVRVKGRGGSAGRAREAQAARDKAGALLGEG